MMKTESEFVNLNSLLNRLPKSIFDVAIAYFESDNYSYDANKKLLLQIEPFGITFDYGLDAIPSNIRITRLLSKDEFVSTKRALTYSEYQELYTELCDFEKKHTILTYDCGLYMLQLNNEVYNLILERDEFQTDNLESLEDRLYKFYVDNCFIVEV